MHNRYKVADIENLKNELELLPETERETRQIGLKDVMKVLGPVLREMRERRGYTNDQLLEVLRAKGIAIGKSTLNDYLRTKRRPAPTTRSTDEKATSEPVRGQGEAGAKPAESGGSPDKGATPGPSARGSLPPPPRGTTAPAARNPS